ncbi:hypothetical protein [uncultured Maricaulis sp.]|uniref:hypothetical protein n=1 Tax=uncultured Maricaulis sp. TaxID=174710 RepID=UPI0025D6EF5D|nr:hypothetical protein [uncultured Maricaulis sp.]
MALLVPVVLIAILLFLALRHRSRDGGLRACLARVETALVAAAADDDAGVRLSSEDVDALREAPEHLFRLVVAVFEGADKTARQRALDAICEYREFRGWKA